MRIRTVTNIDFGSDDNLLFLGFHGFGNDETEMIRIIEALYDGSDHEPNYMSFRGTYSRPFIGNNHWYPDGCSTEERRRECHDVGDAVIELLRSPAYVRFRKVLIGFSQGGYLSYRMVLEHPDSFGAAILMSPSFKVKKALHPLPAAHGLHCVMDVRIARFLPRTSTPHGPNSSRPAISRISSIPAWAMASAMPKSLTCVSGWGCEGVGVNVQLCCPLGSRCAFGS